MPTGTAEPVLILGVRSHFGCQKSAVISVRSVRQDHGLKSLCKHEPLPSASSVPVLKRNTGGLSYRSPSPQRPGHLSHVMFMPLPVPREVPWNGSLSGRAASITPRRAGERVLCPRWPARLQDGQTQTQIPPLWFFAFGESGLFLNEKRGTPAFLRVCRVWAALFSQ